MDAVDLTRDSGDEGAAAAPAAPEFVRTFTVARPPPPTRTRFQFLEFESYEAWRHLNAQLPAEEQIDWERCLEYHSRYMYYDFDASENHPALHGMSADQAHQAVLAFVFRVFNLFAIHCRMLSLASYQPSIRLSTATRRLPDNYLESTLRGKLKISFHAVDRGLAFASPAVMKEFFNRFYASVADAEPAFVDMLDTKVYGKTQNFRMVGQRSNKDPQNPDSVLRHVPIHGDTFSDPAEHLITVRVPREGNPSTMWVDASPAPAPWVRGTTTAQRRRVEEAAATPAEVRARWQNAPNTERASGFIATVPALANYTVDANNSDPTAIRLSRERGSSCVNGVGHNSTNGAFMNFNPETGRVDVVCLSDVCRGKRVVLREGTQRPQELAQNVFAKIRDAFPAGFVTTPKLLTLSLDGEVSFPKDNEEGKTVVVHLFNKRVHMRGRGRTDVTVIPCNKEAIDALCAFILQVLAEAPVRDFFSRDPDLPTSKDILGVPEWCPEGFFGPGLKALHYARVLRVTQRDTIVLRVKDGHTNHITYHETKPQKCNTTFDTRVFSSPLMPRLSALVWYPNLNYRVPDDVLNTFEPPTMKPSPVAPPREDLERTLAPFFEFLRNVICSGNVQVFNFFLKCLMYPVQLPFWKDWSPAEIPLGFMPMLLGQPGTGKSMIFQLLIRAILGDHLYLYLNNSSMLGARFNGIFSNRLCSFIDEMCTDRIVWNKVKGFVTESRMVVERKGLEAEHTNSYGILAAASNNESTSMNLEQADRRLLIIQVGNRLRTDTTYREKIVETLKDPAVHQAFLDYAVHWTPSIRQEVIGRMPPSTRAKQMAVRMQHRPLQDFIIAFARAQLDFVGDIWNRVYESYIRGPRAGEQVLYVPAMLFYGHFTAFFTSRIGRDQHAYNFAKFEPFMNSLSKVVVRVPDVEYTAIERQFVNVYGGEFRTRFGNFVPMKAGEKVGGLLTTEQELVHQRDPGTRLPRYTCYSFNLANLRVLGQVTSWEEMDAMLEETAAAAAAAAATDDDF